MSLSNPNLPVTEQRLQEFYHKLLPYIGGGGTGGGHTIEDSEGTDLTQRDTLQFGEGFIAEDDDTNEKTVISPDVMQSGDMSDVITPLPSVQPRYQKYSTEEQVVGEWIDGKPIYQKTLVIPLNNGTTESDCYYINYSIVDLSIDEIIKCEGCVYGNTKTTLGFLGTIKTNLMQRNYQCYVLNGTSNVTLQFIEPNATVLTNVKSSVAHVTIQYTKTTDTAD